MRLVYGFMDTHTGPATCSTLQAADHKELRKTLKSQRKEMAVRMARSYSPIPVQLHSTACQAESTSLMCWLPILSTALMCPCLACCRSEPVMC